MASLLGLNPAIASLNATNVPENPTALKATELDEANENVFRIEPTWALDSPAAVPVDTLRVAVDAPGRSRMSPME